MPATSTTAAAAARRVFHITDWAPVHEALYPEADNDSSIDTLSLPSKPGGPSAAASVSAPFSAALPASSPAPTVRRSPTTKSRSMSVPWRKSVVVPVVRPLGDDLDQRVRDLSLHRSRTAAEPADSPAPTSPGFGNWAGFGDVERGLEQGHEQEQEQEQETHSHADPGYAFGKAKGKKSISGIWRRASVQLKTLVHRRTSIATETLDESPDLDAHAHAHAHPRLHLHLDQKRQLRSSHGPSRSHHFFTTTTNTNTNIIPHNVPSSTPGPASPASSAAVSPTTSPRSAHALQQSPRSSPSQALNARWHRLQKAASTSFRHSRILHGDFALPSHETPSFPGEDLPYSVPRPGIGNEPPVIPRNSGSAARAAVAAWQSEMFPLPFKNKRLTLDSAHNDRESGIGIAVTSTDSVADDMQDLDVVTAEGDVVLGACGPNRVDFVNRLPVELAIQVLAHLDAASLAPASRVSKVWREVTSLQHIWRESYLREKTDTYATSEPIQPGAGLGVPAIEPNMDWKGAYAATEELAKRWKQGKATSVWMNGHSDSIYCLQFDEYVSRIPSLQNLCQPASLSRN